MHPYVEEKAALEAKYRELYQPLYDKRAQVIKGEVDVEVSAEDAEAAGEDEGDAPEGIPDFWLVAFKNHEQLEEQITEKDEDALKHLIDVKAGPLEGDDKGFKLDFHFSANPYFSNAVLTKSYYMIDEEDPILEKAEGTDIQWAPGKNLTVKVGGGRRRCKLNTSHQLSTFDPAC